MPRSHERRDRPSGDEPSVRIGGQRLIYLSMPIERVDCLPRLTVAERAVAQLAAAGLTNAEIGRARSVSARTIANQLATIYRKLGVGSRVELIALVADSDR